MSPNPKLTKARFSNLAKLDAYEQTDSTTRNVLQNAAKAIYTKHELYVISKTPPYAWIY